MGPTYLIPYLRSLLCLHASNRGPSDPPPVPPSMANNYTSPLKSAPPVRSSNRWDSIYVLRQDLRASLSFSTPSSISHFYSYFSNSVVVVDRWSESLEAGSCARLGIGGIESSGDEDCLPLRMVQPSMAALVSGRAALVLAAHARGQAAPRWPW